MKANESDGILLRLANVEDAPILLRFAHALADEEGRASLLRLDMLQDWLRGGLPHFWLAERNGAQVGMAMGYPGFDMESGSTGLHLGDLYVMPQHRRGGVGRMLVTEVGRHTRQQGGEWLSWTVLETNDCATDFYHAIAARDVPVRFMAMGPRAIDALVNKHPGS